jgi:AAA domain
MTRSNKSHDIGFMAAPERLNVLLSRARNGLIMIGNSETFMNARKGKEVWRKLFDHLKQNDHVYEGFPVKCEKHPDRAAILSSSQDFETQCPDGGCKEPWQVLIVISPVILQPLTYSFSGVMLKCGLHKCTSSCHQLLDHSRVLCRTVLTQKCFDGHDQSWQCHTGAPPTCFKCERDKKEAMKRTQRALKEKLRRDEKIQKHLKEVAKVEEEIEQITQSIKDARLDSEQNAILAQKRMDLAAAKERANRTQNSHQEDPPDTRNDDHRNPRNLPLKKPSQTSPEPATSPPAQHSRLREHIKIAVEHNESPSKREWQRQKDQENAHNPAIDKIMEMTGLEEVKAQVLRIKAKVETSIRQGTDLGKERLGLVLLGNPGTGIFFIQCFNHRSNHAKARQLWPGTMRKF